MLCFVFSSCSLFIKEDDEPSYTVRIVWDSELISNYYKSQIVDGDSVYFYERPPGYTNVNIYTLTRLDAETGNLIWRSILFRNIMFCQPIVIDNYVYIFLEPNIILCFNRETGEHTATAAIDIGDNNSRLSWNLVSYNQYLYFGYRDEAGGYFGRIDVNNINQNGKQDEMQTLHPDILWQSETGCIVTAKPVIHNNIAYNSTNTSGFFLVELAGVNIETKQMVFHAAFGGPDDGDVPFPETGGSQNHIFIYGDTLYYLNWSISAWNIPTGKLLYRHVFTRDIPNEQYYMANGLLQAVYYQEKLYYTSRASDSPLGFRNIHCIDAKTGRLVWNDVAKNSLTLDSNLIIVHDRLYVAQSVGLRVYNPENGKLIGVDKSFYGGEGGRNVLYNDYMICVRVNPKTMEGRMVAVYVGK